MDYAEFEKYAVDYAEGNLPDKLRLRMDQARRQDPRLDELARLHEQILTALIETPEAAFPEDLSRRILVAAEERERMLARETRRFRRSLFFWPASAAVATAVASALFYYFRENLASSFGKFGVGKLLTTPIPVPGAKFALPAVYLIAAAVLAIVLWCYHESDYTTL